LPFKLLLDVIGPVERKLLYLLPWQDSMIKSILCNPFSLITKGGPAAAIYNVGYHRRFYDAYIALLIYLCKRKKISCQVNHQS
jgi:hypothetical protein